MPLSINKVMLAGNLTRCPEVKFLANEQAVCNFGLAINRKYKGRDGEQKEETTFVEVTCWGRTAELCGQYLDKGRNVHVEGRLKLDTWEDKNGGAQRSKLGVVAEQVNFIDWGDKADGIVKTTIPKIRMVDFSSRHSSHPCRRLRVRSGGRVFIIDGVQI